jgi:hypothetical protein
VVYHPTLIAGTSGRRRASNDVSRKRAMLVLAAVAVAAGALSWLWGALALPGRAIIRGHAGDVAAVALVYALCGLAWRAPLAARAALTAAIAVTIELAQRGAGSGGGAARDLTLGRHFDPWDLFAYAVGLVAAIAWERQSTARWRVQRSMR